jgi:hypothetical protein
VHGECCPYIVAFSELVCQRTAGVFNAANALVYSSQVFLSFYRIFALRMISETFFLLLCLTGSVVIYACD